MEEEGIGLVLAKASELRLKISNCIHKASSSPDNKQEKGGEEALVVNGDKKNGGFNSAGEEDDEGEEGDEGQHYDEEAERLLNIHDALESLEVQLGNLQNLQQQQRYDREVALGEIEFSRKMLLEKLKQYKGKDLEVIQEASVFAGETVEHNNDLLLPPYPSRPPNSHILDNNNGYASPFHYTRKSLQNGAVTNDSTNITKKDTNDPSQRSPKKGLLHLFGSVVKTVLPFVGLVYVLSLSGFGQNVVKRGGTLKVLDTIKEQSSDGEKRSGECPPGKILVIEHGETRCLVKERVEIPFGSVGAKPDINYGSG